VNIEHDYARRLLLLAEDIHRLDLEMAELDRFAAEHQGTEFAVYYASESQELRKTLMRVAFEYGEHLLGLAKRFLAQ